MPPIQPRQKVEYKRPRRLNAVSISLLLATAAGVYTLYALWPVFALRSAVKGELAEVLPDLWRSNLRPEEIARPAILELRKVLTERLRRAGVRDKKLQVVFERGRKQVAIQARFQASAVFPGWGKRVDVACAPRVQTDAGHIEW